MAREMTTLEDVRAVLHAARVIAVMGAHPQRERPASYVPAYLHDAGYRILPVNPQFAGTMLFDADVMADLAEIREPVDIVDVFRRSDALPALLPSILAMEIRPRLVWFQLGIRHDAVAAALLAAGIDVVQDRCTLADHRRLGLSRKR